MNITLFERLVVFAILIISISCGSQKEQDAVLRTYNELCQIYSNDNVYDKFEALKTCKQYYSNVYTEKLKDYLKLAYSGTKKQITDLTIAEQIEILRLRRTKNSLVVKEVMIDSILLSRQLASKLIFGACMDVETVQIIDKNRARIVINTGLSKSGFNFYLEDNIWKIDIYGTLNAINERYKNIPNKFNSTREDFIRRSLNLKKDEEIPWEPLG